MEDEKVMLYDFVVEKVLQDQCTEIRMILWRKGNEQGLPCAIHIRRIRYGSNGFKNPTASLLRETPKIYPQYEFQPIKKK